MLDPVTEARERAIATLLDKYDKGEVEIILAKGVLRELERPETPPSVKRLMPEIYTVEVGLSPKEIRKKSQIERLLQGEAQIHKHQADADHVFEAVKYHANYFITYDKRILRRGAKINEALSTGLIFCDLESAIEKLK